MHYIQSKILDNLLYAETLRYSQLRPDGIESNHFAYHLKELLKEQLIAKSGNGYTLAPKGLAYVDRLSHTHMKPRSQPTIITLIKVTNNAGQTLLFERNYQPYIHRLGWPSGKLHLDESIDQAAHRELAEKTGLTGVKLVHRGLVELEIKQASVVISQLMAHIFEGKVAGSPVLKQDTRGIGRWAVPSEYSAKQLMPGYQQIEQLTASKQLFFESVSAVI